MSKRKPNITVDDIGTYYQKGGEVYLLEGFKPEPEVTMLKLSGGQEVIKKPLSHFTDFVRLNPEKPRKSVDMLESNAP